MDCGDVPEELMMDILLRLPVKSLTRFNCVCKSWRSLFESRTFMTKHLNNDKRDESVLLRYSTNDFPNSSYSYSLLSYDVIKNIDFRGHYLNVVACCNGIICLERQGEILLWNPATTQIKKLMHDPIDNRSDGFTYGFGYDRKGNDYKVIKLPRLSNTSSAYNFAHIYELSSNSWRICDAPLPNSFYHKDDARRRVYTNGIYSWLVNDKYGPKYRFVVSFDMSKEVFITTELPNQYKESVYGEKLGTLNERVVLFTSYYDHLELKAGILMLNSYGVKESWTKLYTVRPSVFESYHSVNFRKNGDILATCPGKVVVLNPTMTQEIKVPQLDFLQGMLPCIWFYKESLVPIN